MGDFAAALARLQSPFQTAYTASKRLQEEASMPFCLVQLFPRLMRLGDAGLWTEPQ